MAIGLTPIGRYESGIFDESAAEIVAHDPGTQRLFVVNANNAAVDVLDIANPTNPTLISTIDVTSIGAGANSVAVANGVVAIAVENEDEVSPGTVAFFDANGTFLNSVTVGVLPDMVTFTPDGQKVLVANEGEPGEEEDPEGSISIIDISGGVANATVMTADFTAFNGRENELRGRGVRIFPGNTVAQDLEPEYIAVSPDGSTAFVALQENNAIAAVNIDDATIEDVLPLGYKNHSQGPATIQQFPFTQLPALGTTPGGQQIQLGGLSGLWFEGIDPSTGSFQFVTVPDRGPNGEPTDVDGDGDNERPFVLPDYQARVVRFELNPVTGIGNIQQLPLVRQDGTTPITGRPNIPGVDEEPVDLLGNLLTYDEFGADLEGVVIAPNGNFWMVDEYRPAIYNFDPNGVLINRFVPQGTGALAGQAPGTFGTETLPAEYSNRRRNRGFEAVALDANEGILYSFIQTPLANPDRAASDNSDVIRILGIDTATGNPVSEYVYLLEGSDLRDAKVDKIGDAVYSGDGKFFAIERDSSTSPTGKKFIFELDLTAATNLLAPGAPALPAGSTLEQLSADQLAGLGIQPVNKTKVTNLPSIGYLAGDKPEGLALLPDGRLAVLNDNDFGLLDNEIPVDGTVPLNPNPVPVVLGVINYPEGNRLDASDEDGAINLQNWPVFGMFMPDSIDSFEANGQAYYVTANEGDARDEDARIADLTLDPTAFPNAAALQEEGQLGRLEVSTINGDIDGDGDYDRLFAYGGRSFTIWDRFGNQVYDSSDDFARITAQLFPEIFNSNGNTETFDGRSDAKGAEPEAIATGVVDGSTYAFIGLERIGGIMVYDVSNPTAPNFVQYINPNEIDIGPEGLEFIAAADSPNGSPLLAVGNEVSGTTTIYQINPAFFDLDNGSDVFQVTAGLLDQRVGGLRALEDNDTVTGSAEGDSINGNQGNDIVSGGAGDDTLFGGRGSDTLAGGDGNDVISGDLGRDVLTGDGGDDIFVLRASTAVTDVAQADSITDFGNGADRIGLTGGLTETDLTLEAGSTGTLIRIAASGSILGVASGVTPAQLIGNFVPANLGIVTL